MTEKTTLSSDEIETTINYGPQIGEWAEIYTTDKNVMKRYEKFMNKYPSRCKLLHEDRYSMTFSVHPKNVGIYPRAPRQMTDEQKEALAARLMQARNV